MKAWRPRSDDRLRPDAPEPRAKGGLNCSRTVTTARVWPTVSPSVARGVGGGTCEGFGLRVGGAGSPGLGGDLVSHFGGPSWKFPSADWLMFQPSDGVLKKDAGSSQDSLKIPPARRVRPAEVAFNDNVPRRDCH